MQQQIPDHGWQKEAAACALLRMAAGSARNTHHELCAAYSASQQLCSVVDVAAESCCNGRVLLLSANSQHKAYMSSKHLLIT
jgi:hypothetical protein